MLHYYANGHVLDQQALHSSNGKRHLADIDLVNVDDDSAQPPWESIREFILEAVGARDFDLACEIFVLGKTCAEYGAEIERSAGTACRNLKKLKMRMRKALLANLRQPSVALDEAAHDWLRSWCREIVAQEISTCTSQASSGCLIHLGTLAVKSPVRLLPREALLGEERFEHEPTIREWRRYLQAEDARLFSPSHRWFGIWRDAEHDQWVCGFPSELDVATRLSVSPRTVRQQRIVLEAA